MELELAIPLEVTPGEHYFINQSFGGNGKYYQDNGIDVVGHNGLDLSATIGQSVLAAHDGIITSTETDSKGGIGVEIRTDRKYTYKGIERYFKTIYWHLENYCVIIGQEVKQREKIGQADNTGFSTGPHLHFGLKPIDDNFNTLEKDNGYFGAIDPAPSILKDIMKHVLYAGNQYLLYPPLKIAIELADITELQKLTKRGLMSLPDSVGADALKDYYVIIGLEKSRLRDLFNF